MSLAIPSKSVFIKEWVSQLEQAKSIKEEDAAQWYDDVVMAEPERFVWHFERLKGWGGSDIGEIAASYLGYPNLFSTVRELGEYKLMMRSPGGSTPLMRRGTLLEDPLSIIFREDYHAVRHDKFVGDINGYSSDAHTWLRGNTDDVVTMPDGSVIIIDYKCPTKIKAEPPIQYCAQLHQYRFILHEENPAIDNSLLAIVTFDYDKGLAVPVDVPYSEDIERAVIDGGDKAWSMVVNGDLRALSEFKFTPDEVPQVEFDDDVVEKVIDIEDDWSSYLLLEKAAEKEKTRLVDALADTLRQASPTGQLYGQKGLPLSMGTPSIRRTINTPYVNELIEKRSIDSDAFMVPGPKVDPDKAVAYFVANNIDVTPFLSSKIDAKKLVKEIEEKGFTVNEAVKEGFSVSLRVSKKKGLSAENIEEATTMAGKAVSQALTLLEQFADEQAQEEPDDQSLMAP